MKATIKRVLLYFNCRHCLGILVLLYSLGCQTGVKTSSVTRDVSQASRPQNVSIISLIANPDKYHKSNVRIFGLGRFAHELSIVKLFNSEPFYDSKNALWLELPEDAFSEAVESCNGEYIIVDGIFNKSPDGGMYGGIIRDISYLTVYGNPNITIIDVETDEKIAVREFMDEVWNYIERKQNGKLEDK